MNNNIDTLAIRYETSDFDIELFAKNMVHYRKIQRIKQRELAERAGIAVQSVSAYEHGKKIPSLATACAIAKHLGVSLDTLCGDTVDTLCGDTVEKDDRDTQIKLKTAGDVINLLGVLQKAVGMSITPVEYDLPVEEYIPTGYSPTGEEEWVTTGLGVDIRIFEPRIHNFYSNCGKLHELGAQNVLDQKAVDELIQALISKAKEDDLF